MGATLHGDPSKPGISVLRIKWPKGTMSRPHTHPEDRHVVVLSGTWYTGTGEAFGPEKEVPLKGRRVHAASGGGAALGRDEDEEAVIQITGYGPSGNNFLKAGEPPFAQEK
jgi:quercetin dioxygenase-like cupin family protein